MLYFNIDGYHKHKYEVGRHDFETWRSKVSGRGGVVFHDISVRLNDYGVWRFWGEIKQIGIEIDTRWSASGADGE